MGTENKKQVLFTKSRVAPKRDDELIDSVAASKRMTNRRAFDLLMEAQHYWNQMSQFRKDRERNKRYLYGDQWGDVITVKNKSMTEEKYIMQQGNIPLKNNIIRKNVKSVLGVFRSQHTEPTCIARDRDEQKLGETMSTVLQYNMQLNRMDEVNARTLEEFLIGGLAVHRKSFGWRIGKLDCWTDYVQPNMFFVDNNARDFRGWDVSIIGELHDISFGDLCEQFAHSPEDYNKLRNIYSLAADRHNLASYAEKFGYSRYQNYDFLFTNDPGRCRVIELWRKEQKRRYRCRDYQTGDLFKIELEDYGELVEKVNEERRQMGLAAGMPEEEIPLIEAEYFIDNYWYFYYLTPFGDILQEGETPYAHGSHPYVFRAYPFIDGEIHSFVADIIDQQRYINRLITLYDWIMRASAKGVLMVPADCIPETSSPEEFAEAWTTYNGILVYTPSTSGKVPTQVSANSTNIGIAELLNLQLKFTEDISGVTNALQGKASFSGESAAHYMQQAENSTISLLDLLDSYNNFLIDGAYKDVKNIQQFYDTKRVVNIAGKKAQIEYDPEKIRDVEFDLNIAQSMNTPVFRQLANDMLMKLWQSQAINTEQLLENGDFPFADDLLQSIRAQQEQAAQGQMPSGISPELMQQAQGAANPDAVNKLYDAMKQ